MTEGLVILERLEWLERWSVSLPCVGSSKVCLVDRIVRAGSKVQKVHGVGFSYPMPTGQGLLITGEEEHCLTG